MTWHAAILRSAAALVPREVRGEWLREWTAELYYVDHDRAGFCFGAYRDAFWLRRNAARRPLLESPFACLFMLAVLAAIAGTFAFNGPGSDPEPGALGPVRSFLTIVGYAA